jgi:hypothetical protein
LNFILFHRRRDSEPEYGFAAAADGVFLGAGVTASFLSAPRAPAPQHAVSQCSENQAASRNSAKQE